MKVLIDTHIAIWAVLNDPKLPERARDIILDRENEIFYSTASVWEITIKHMLHPDKLRINETVINPPAELGRLTDAGGGEQSIKIENSAV